MVDVFKKPLTAAQIKDKARALGADLVGIADGALLEANPPDPADPRRPSDITEHDGERVIVLAKRYSAGVTRITAWGDRHKIGATVHHTTGATLGHPDFAQWVRNIQREHVIGGDGGGAVGKHGVDGGARRRQPGHELQRDRQGDALQHRRGEAGPGGHDARRQRADHRAGLQRVGQLP